MGELYFPMLRAGGTILFLISVLLAKYHLKKKKLVPGGISVRLLSLFSMAL